MNIERLNLLKEKGNEEEKEMSKFILDIYLLCDQVIHSMDESIAQFGTTTNKMYDYMKGQKDICNKILRHIRE